MAYTPINWDETTPINPDNLNKMDDEIDSNENRITDIDNKSSGTVTNDLQGQIDDNENRITDVEDGTTIVENSKNLQGENIEVVAEGSTNISGGNSKEINLLSGGQHIKYMYSVYKSSGSINLGVDDSNAAYIVKVDSGGTDYLRIEGQSSGDNTFYYKVWALR